MVRGNLIIRETIIVTFDRIYHLNYSKVKEKVNKIPSGHFPGKFFHLKHEHLVSTKKAIQAKTISNSLTDLIIDCITDIKGKNIILLNLKSIDDAPADYFIVCEGDSTTQVRAISQNIERRLKDELRLHPAHVEGTQHAKWVCMDYFDIVVHIFHPETRRFYDLEQLWSDAEMIEYQNV